MANLTSSDDPARHTDTIAAIAEETHQPLPVVKEIYEEIFARLQANARIYDYVDLFAARRTKDVLRSRA